jgi:hypothetical protein
LDGIVTSKHRREVGAAIGPDGGQGRNEAETKWMAEVARIDEMAGGVTRHSSRANPALLVCSTNCG